MALIALRMAGLATALFMAAPAAAWEQSERGADSDSYEYWLKSIGDPGTDRARLTAVSPISHAADWRPPVLLIHGTSTASCRSNSRAPWSGP